MDEDVVFVMSIMRATGMTIHVKLGGEVQFRDKIRRERLTKDQVKFRLAAYAKRNPSNGTT